MKYLLIVPITIGILFSACSPSIPSQEVQVLNQKPIIEIVEEPKEDKKGKFVTKVVIYSIIGLGLLTYNDYIR